MLVRNSAFVIAAGLAAAFLVSWFVYKRADVNWSSFIIAGPMTLLRPSRYFRAGKARIPSMLFALAMLALAVGWVAGWAVDNR